MTDVEYRAWFTVPGLPLDDEPAWTPLAEQLERGEARACGPVLTWDGGTLRVVMSADTPSESDAAERMYDALARDLRAVGLGHLYPTEVEIAPADDEHAAATA